MIFISILIIIVAIALPSLKQNLSPILLLRVSTIIMIYAGAISLNALYIQSIGSGIGIYSGLFHVSSLTQQLDTFLLILGSLILIPRPGVYEYIQNYTSSLQGPQQQLPLLDRSALSNEGIVDNNTYNKDNLYPSMSNTEIGSGLGGKYSIVILFTSLGSLLLMSSSDLLSMYLSIELQSFGLYLLATLFRDNKLATNAGLKYFLLGGLSSCIILLGSAIVYAYTGLTNLDSIYSLLSVSQLPSLTYTNLATSPLLSWSQDLTFITLNQGVTLGFILILIGFLFKISAAPLHNWAPDVYDDSPTIVTIWLTIIPKIAILVFLLELIISGLGYNTSTSYAAHNLVLDNVDKANTLSDFFRNLLLVSSLLSLLFGSIVGLAQSRIKRLLAYSTISHIGFILLALAVNTEQSIESFIFYLIQYSLTNLDLFLIILAFGYLLSNKNKVAFTKTSAGTNLTNSVSNNLLSTPAAATTNLNLNETISLSSVTAEVVGAGKEEAVENSDIRFISELKGQFINNPLLSIGLSVCLFSLAGIPPLMGFFSKQLVLYSALQNGYYFISVVAILVSVISASYYLKIVRILFTDNNSVQNKIASLPHTPKSGPGVYGLNNNSRIIEGQYFISNTHGFLISTLTLAILFFIFKPSLILNSTQLLSLTLFHC